MSRASAEDGMNRSIACKIRESNMAQVRELIPFQQCFSTLKDKGSADSALSYGCTSTSTCT